MPSNKFRNSQNRFEAFLGLPLCMRDPYISNFRNSENGNMMGNLAAVYIAVPSQINRHPIECIDQNLKEKLWTFGEIFSENSPVTLVAVTRQPQASKHSSVTDIKNVGLGLTITRLFLLSIWLWTMNDVDWALLHAAPNNASKISRRSSPTTAMLEAVISRS